MPVVIESQQTAGSAEPFDLTDACVGGPERFPSCRARAEEMPYQLVDYARMRDHRNALASMDFRDRGDGLDTTEAELSVALAARPTKLMIGLIQVGGP